MTFATGKHLEASGLEIRRAAHGFYVLGRLPLVNEAIATGQCQNESVGYQVHFCEDNQESWILASRVMGGYPALCQKPLWTSDVLFFPSPFRSYLVKVLRVSSFCTLPPLPAIGRCVCAVLTDCFRTSSCYQIPELGLYVCVEGGRAECSPWGEKSTSDLFLGSGHCDRMRGEAILGSQALRLVS